MLKLAERKQAQLMWILKIFKSLLGKKVVLTSALVGIHFRSTYRVSQKDVYTRLIFRIIMGVHLFGILYKSASMNERVSPNGFDF
jgi:hypothetical protein